MQPATVREKWGKEHSLPVQPSGPDGTSRRYRVQVAYWDQRGVRVAALNQEPLWLPYEAFDLRSLAKLPELKKLVKAARPKKKGKKDGSRRSDTVCGKTRPGALRLVRPAEGEARALG